MRDTRRERGCEDCLLWSEIGPVPSITLMRAYSWFICVVGRKLLEKEKYVRVECTYTLLCLFLMSYAHMDLFRDLRSGVRPSESVPPTRTSFVTVRSGVRPSECVPPTRTSFVIVRSGVRPSGCVPPRRGGVDGDCVPLLRSEERGLCVCMCWCFFPV